MGLIWEIFKALGESETSQEREKRINDEIFEMEADEYGLDKEEREECKKSGMTPDEWEDENEDDYED